MELREGIPVSPGIAIARAFPLDSEEFAVSARPISPGGVEEECRRFGEAVEAAVEEVAALRRSGVMPDEVGQIFDAHVQILLDPKIHRDVEAKIRQELLPAEYSVRNVFLRHAQRLEQLEDGYFAERARDVRDIEHRILRMLLGARQSQIACLTEPVVVVARDLTPSQTASLDREKVCGIAVDLGGRTSHTAIMARSMGVPAVVGLRDVSEKAEEGAVVVVDGNHGQVIVAPDTGTLEKYELLRQAYESYRVEMEEGRYLPAETVDGHEIRLSGNIECPEDAGTVLDAGGDGVGLFRTEFLFTDPHRPPTEEEHYRAYRKCAELLAGRPLVIRTFDLGGDKMQLGPGLGERNPFMGLRSLRFCLWRPEIFLPQLKGILRAAVSGEIRIMFPMVATVEEVRRAKEFLAEAERRLRAERKEYRADIPLGIMVETPSAALTADLLAEEVDFFSVGTNDLIQYTLAVDRGNERVAGLYQPAHPAILRLLSRVIEVGVQKDVKVSVCGEICGEPVYTLLLLGMGLRDLSMAPAMIPVVKRVARSVTMERAREVAAAAIDLADPVETERCLRQGLHEILPILA